MTKTIIKAPFRADHAGSLLRPQSIYDARRKFAEGATTAEQLYTVETEEIRRI